MKTITIFGAAGYVGSELSRLLLKEGFKVRGLDNLSRNDGGALIELCKNENFEFIRGDVTNQGDCYHGLGEDTDFIVLAAALVGEPICRMNPKQAWAVNHEGVLNVLRANYLDKPTLLLSTGSVYGVVPDGFCTEDSQCNTTTEYGLSKLAAEKATLERPNTMVYRFATACGVSPNLRLDLLINDLVYQAVKNKAIVIFQSDFKRTFISVRDFARSIYHAITTWEEMQLVGRIFNVGDDSLNYSKREVAEIIKTYTECAVFHGDQGYVDKDVRNYTVSYEKLRSTGFRCIDGMKKIIQELVKVVPLVTGDRRYFQV